MFASADVQTSGKILPAAVAVRRPATSSSSVSVPASKNFSISFSSASATISISASRAASTAAVMSAGTAASVNVPLSSAWNMYAFFATRSTTPRERFLLADRQLNRNDGAAARLAQRLQRALEARALAIEPVDDDQSRQVELLGRRPHLFGLHHHAGDRVDDDQRGVGDAAAPRAHR